MIPIANMKPSEQAPYGLPCAECQYVIPLTIQRLLARGPIFCSNCGTRFSLVEEASMPALDALGKIDQAVQRAGAEIENIQKHPEASLEGGNSDGR